MPVLTARTAALGRGSAVQRADCDPGAGLDPHHQLGQSCGNQNFRLSPLLAPSLFSWWSGRENLNLIHQDLSSGTCSCNDDLLGWGRLPGLSQVLGTGSNSQLLSSLKLESSLSRLRWIPEAALRRPGPAPRACCSAGRCKSCRFLSV